MSPGRTASPTAMSTTVTIASKDRSGLVMDIATVLNALNAKVRSLTARDTGSGLALTTVTLEVKSNGEPNISWAALTPSPVSAAW